MSDPRDEQRQREAREALSRVAGDSETIGTSSFAREALRARDHFAGSDGEDEMEVWGKRIGRGFSLLAVLLILFYLVDTYLLN